MGYKIQEGDTLSKIGAKYGLDWRKIQEVNPQITDPDVIIPGQVLNIPEELPPTSPPVPGATGVPPTGAPPAEIPEILKPKTQEEIIAEQKAKLIPTPPAPPPTEVPPSVIPPPTEPPPVEPPPPKEPVVSKTVEELKTQIVDVQGKIAVATSDLERETAIQEMVALAASLGLKYPIEAIEALTKPSGETEEEIRTKLYEKYGIEDLETKFKERPTQTFEEIYATAFSDLKLGELKAEIDDIRTKIADVETKRDEAIARHYENPWLPEASKVGRAKRDWDRAQRELDRLTNQMTLANNLYTRGQEEAENVATRALATFVQEREWTKEELKFYIDRAELDVSARLKAREAEEEKELLRYFPSYLKEFAPKPTAPPTSYKEWELAGGKAGTRKTYAEWLEGEKKEEKSFLSSEDHKSLTAIGVPKVVADAIAIALSEGQDLEPIRLGLAAIYGKEKGYKYLDLFMPYIQTRYGESEE